MARSLSIMKGPSCPQLFQSLTRRLSCGAGALHTHEYTGFFLSLSSFSILVVVVGTLNWVGDKYYNITLLCLARLFENIHTLSLSGRGGHS